MVLLLLACTGPRVEPPTIAERIGDYRFATPIDAPATLAMLDGTETDTRATTCGGCHDDHHAEWSRTTHASAVHDVQFLAELAKPGQPRWLCLNCHAPTLPQRAELITPSTRLAEAGSVERLSTSPNPSFDASRVAEGVGCATCHVRRDPDGKGTVVGPRGSGRAPHRVRADAEALRGVCEGCHSPGADIVITPTFPCWFTTVEEITVGPLAGADCVDCHMPGASRPAAEGAPAEALRQHTWPGGGLPKHVDQLPAPGDWQPGLDVEVRSAPVEVRLQNARAAHAIPTGDPERHVLVEARALDASGVEVSKDQLRIGQTWDWGDDTTGRPATKLADNRLQAGETRAWTPVLKLDQAARVEVTVTYVRLTEANAAKMAHTRLDAELQALWPDLPVHLAGPLADYPRRRVIFSESVALVR